MSAIQENQKFAQAVRQRLLSDQQRRRDGLESVLLALQSEYDVNHGVLTALGVPTWFQDAAKSIGDVTGKRASFEISRRPSIEANDEEFYSQIDPKGHRLVGFADCVATLSWEPIGTIGGNTGIRVTTRKNGTELFIEHGFPNDSKSKVTKTRPTDELNEEKLTEILLEAYEHPLSAGI